MVSASRRPRQPARFVLPVFIGLFAVLFGGRAISLFYTEALWFADVGYRDVFWTRILTELTVRAIATAVASGILLFNLALVARRLGPVHVRRRYGNLEISEQVPRQYVMIGMITVSILAGLWLADVEFGRNGAFALQTFAKRVTWGVTDPLFQRDLSFYVFALPVYLKVAEFFLLTLAWSIFMTIVGYALVGAVRWRENKLELDDRPRVHLAALCAAVVLLLAVRYWLSRYGVLFQGHGIGGGVGYTDVIARLPAKRVLAALCLITAITLVYSAIRRSWVAPIISAGLLLLAAFMGGYLVPSAIQKFRVEPDELARESPFIEWNIQYTRMAYGLDSIEKRAYPYKPGVPRNTTSLAALPIWDPAQLHTVLNQQHALFGYYTFPDVDADRYATASGKSQVMVGVREFQATGLQENARSWQNLHLNPDFIRGLGAVIVPAAQAVEGKAHYWLQRVPVERSADAPPEVTLEEPSVYFGETMEAYAIVNTRQEITRSSARDVGVSLGSFGRLLAFAWRFSEKNLLFAGQLTDSSRVLFRRRLDDRLAALAPFIVWDRDPLPVLSRGRIFWIIDGYTISPNFPIARPLQVQSTGQLRYIRNSVKAVVDAVNGQTTLYAMSPDEPILATYRAVFPSLFRDASAFPAELLPHVRYPEFLLRAQADILEEYHIDTPDAFYAGEDVWRLPETGARTESASQPFRPQYSMMSVDPASPPEFVTTAPFIPNRRENLTALLIVRNDPAHYGRMVLFEMPRDEQIAGPGQIEATIEQDPVISRELTPWRQSGSDVELGNVRIVPLDSSLVYVVPIFLSAAAKPIPELQRVVVSDGDRVVMAPSLLEALAGLRGTAELPAVTAAASPAPAGTPGGDDWAVRALDLMRASDAALRSGDWAAYGARQRELRQLLEQVARRR